MSYRLVGPTCSSPACTRPVYDRESGACFAHWSLARAVVATLEGCGVERLLSEFRAELDASQGETA